MDTTFKGFFKLAILGAFIASIITFLPATSVAQKGHDHTHKHEDGTKHNHAHPHDSHQKTTGKHSHDDHTHGTKNKIQNNAGAAGAAGHSHNHKGHSQEGHDHKGQGAKDHNHKGHKGGEHGHGDEHSCHCHYGEVEGQWNEPADYYDPVSFALNHIGDANEFHVWKNTAIPLPVMLYKKGEGWTTCMSSKFHHGCTAYDGFAMIHSRVKRIKDKSFPKGEVHVCIGERKELVFNDDDTPKMKKGEQEFNLIPFVHYNGKNYDIEDSTTWDGGMFGGGPTSFYDFSITKNVFTMFLASLILMLVFFKVAKAYKTRAGMAPTGLQAFMEPFITFIRDEVSIPMMGDKYEKFQPFILSIFFFVLLCNLLGLVPFFPGSANVTGNIAVTFVLAVLAFLVTNFNGNKHYWEHVLWMPGIPWWVKVFVLTPVEILGLIIKPFSLMIRLFANITAGHIIIISLIGLIFIFGKNGTSSGGAAIGGVVGIAFTAFMNLIELIVAFIQAFIFATLTASYIGAATDEGHHGDDHHHHEEEHATAHA